MKEQSEIFSEEYIKSLPEKLISALTACEIDLLSITNDKSELMKIYESVCTQDDLLSKELTKLIIEMCEIDFDNLLDEVIILIKQQQTYVVLSEMPSEELTKFIDDDATDNQALIESNDNNQTSKKRRRTQDQSENLSSKRTMTESYHYTTTTTTTTTSTSTDAPTFVINNTTRQIYQRFHGSQSSSSSSESDLSLANFTGLQVGDVNFKFHEQPVTEVKERNNSVTLFNLINDLDIIIKTYRTELNKNLISTLKTLKTNLTQSLNYITDYELQDIIECFQDDYHKLLSQVSLLKLDNEGSIRCKKVLQTFEFHLCEIEKLIANFSPRSTVITLPEKIRDNNKVCQLLILAQKEASNALETEYEQESEEDEDELETQHQKSEASQSTLQPNNFNLATLEMLLVKAKSYSDRIGLQLEGGATEEGFIKLKDQLELYNYFNDASLEKDLNNYLNFLIKEYASMSKSQNVNPSIEPDEQTTSHSSKLA